MTDKKNPDSLQLDLCNFTGTTQYYYTPIFKNINYTDGVRYFMQNAGGGAYWFLNLVATEIIPKLENEFYFIELTVNINKSADIIVQLDEGEPILYEKHLKYTDCPPSEKPYKFCLENNSEKSILCLLSEY